MRAARFDRDRDLLQQAAGVFSAGYPLDLLIEKLGELLAEGLDAEALCIVLPDSRGELEYVYLYGDDRIVERDFSWGGEPFLDVMASGEALLLSDPSSVVVPLRYRDESLGVIGVQRADAVAFDEDTVQALRAIAHYLAIAVRDQRSAWVSAVRRRGPRGFSAVVIAVAAVATVLVSLFWWNHTRADVNRARDHERAIADAVAADLRWYVLDAKQVAALAAGLLPKNVTSTSMESRLTAMLRSAQSPQIYGIGIWYEPYRFSRGSRYYGPYAHWTQGHRNVIVTREWMTPKYDYPSHPWYRSGMNAHGTTVMTDPYFDVDYTYVSAVRSFGAGVVSVDSIVPFLSADLQRYARQERAIYVTTAKGQLFAVSGRMPLQARAIAGNRTPAAFHVSPTQYIAYLDERQGRDRVETLASFGSPNWIVHISTPARVFYGDLRGRRQVLWLEILVLWLLVGAVLFARWRAFRESERSRTLALRGVELESEIAQRVKMEEVLRDSAFRDALTGLPNRAALLEELKTAIARRRSRPDSNFAVLFVDLDRFNVVNDSLGHHIGDRLLQQLASRLRERLDGGCMLARLGGDEFVVLVKNVATPEIAAQTAQRIHDVLREPFHVNGQELFVNTSIGVALGDEFTERPEQVLRDADLAMYEAKRHGRSQYRVFNRSMHERAIALLELESDLRRALSRGEFFLEFQPIASLTSNRIAGVEALVRWNHPRRGRVAPDDFIPVAEQNGLITEIDAFVVQEACRLAKPWIAAMPDLYLAVNCSAAHFARESLVSAVSRALRENAFPPHALKLEITETAVMQNAEVARKILLDLPRGVTAQIDDFGTGYSSLAYLRALPITELKIDRSFIFQILESTEAREIVRAIISLAKTLGLAVTAEGVEVAAQAALLTEFGAEFAQGFYYAAALPAGDVLRFLERFGRLAAQS